MTTQLKSRSEMLEKYTWDLTSMYATVEQWEQEFEQTSKKVPSMAEFAGTLASSSTQLLKAIETSLELTRSVVNLYVYSHLKKDEDTANAASQSLEARALQLYAQLNQVSAFMTPEILAIDSEVLAQWVESEELSLYRQYLDNVTRVKPHILSQEQELLMAQMDEVLSKANNTFGVLNNADLVFPTIQDSEGKDVQLSHGLYGQLLESTDRRVRKDTFEKFYSVYDQFKNTFAAILGTKMKSANVKAKIRHYNSARHAALSENNVPESVYDTLLETIGRRLPLLHRYMELRRQLLNLDKLETYDLYTPLLGEAPIKFTYEEAKEIALEALKPMGEEYMKIIHAAFDERWIDVYENKGKRSGGYSSGTYDSKPYILLNWHDGINWLYTLVHELGHSAHSYLTHKYQPYVYGHYSIFLAEIASTTNENLLTDYLLKKYDDPRIQLYILNHFLDGLKSTVFRQTQFAEFEHFMHESDAKGIPLTHEFLKENYRQLNEKYYGEAVNSDSEVALEWSRIPHFYYNYYVFQYATGFAAATSFAKDILAGNQEVLEKYLNFLKSGCSHYPIETMKLAGLDMTQPDYIEATLDVFEQRLNEFEALMKQ